ncbi:MAG: response regulator [Acidobacteriota bacterium]
MPKKILLADDSVTIQKVVELTFAEGDYEVISVSNGRAAIDKLKEMRPDILLCDIIMPEVSGYEVASFVKKDPAYKGIPVILLTGTTGIYRRDIHTRGADGGGRRPRRGGIRFPSF